MTDKPEPRIGRWFITYPCCKKFYLFDPRPEDVDMRDIAHALSMNCRFNGHCREFYSVAEHSIAMSQLIDPKYAIHAFLHDAAEAYIGDIISPMKSNMYFWDENYDEMERIEELERPILNCIYEALGIELPDAATIAEIKRADLRILASEKRDLVHPDSPDWPMLKDVEPYPDKIKPITNVFIKQLFLARWTDFELEIDYRKGN